MRYTCGIITILLFSMMSCQQDTDFDNPTPGELLVKDQFVNSANPSDTSTLIFERDSHKRWIRMYRSWSQTADFQEIIAYRQQDGRIHSLRTVFMGFQGMNDTLIHKLFYQNNSNKLEYALTEDKYGNGLLRVDSLRYFYNSSGQIESVDYYSTDNTGTNILSTNRLEYDPQGNIIKDESEHYYPFSGINSIEYEYDYSKKAPVTLEQELVHITGFYMEHHAVNLLKKYSDSNNSVITPLVYSLNYGSSQFNSFSRPTQLLFEGSGGIVNSNTKRFFFYE